VVNIFGVLALTDPTSARLADLTTRPLLLPADLPADEVIPALRYTRQPMALVADEHDRVVGPVTADDVLRQIVV